MLAVWLCIGTDLFIHHNLCISVVRNIHMLISGIIFLLSILPLQVNRNF